MKIILSISRLYCRGLIYQARPRRFARGFDESNPYDRINIAKAFIFMVGKKKFDFEQSALIKQRLEGELVTGKWHTGEYW
jgi:hypothetical protein